MLVLHAAVLAYTQSFAVFGKLRLALLLRRAALEALCGSEMRVGHSPVICDIFLHVRRVTFLRCKELAGGRGRKDDDESSDLVFHLRVLS